MIYKLYIRKPNIVADAAYKMNEDGSITSFIFNSDNLDYQEYLNWVAEGNQPLPADQE